MMSDLRCSEFKKKKNNLSIEGITIGENTLITGQSADDTCLFLGDDSQ